MFIQNIYKQKNNWHLCRCHWQHALSVGGQIVFFAHKKHPVITDIWEYIHHFDIYVYSTR